MSLVTCGHDVPDYLMVRCALWLHHSGEHLHTWPDEQTRCPVVSPEKDWGEDNRCRLGAGHLGEHQAEW